MSVFPPETIDIPPGEEEKGFFMILNLQNKPSAINDHSGTFVWGMEALGASRPLSLSLFLISPTDA